MSLSPLAVGFTSPPYSFRPLVRDDLTMISHWLHAPEIMRWWGDPDEEFALIEEDLDGAGMAQWVVFVEGKPFAYAQAYDVRAWPQSHFAHLPAGSMAIDAFVGEPHLIGRGHGSRFLRALAEKLIAAGTPLVAIDPVIDNERARRAYRKAGFRGEEPVLSPAGLAVLMIFG
ncbi:MAG: GNAT family N-acetyltransferase [Hyphomicrobiales bacterium]|nr:GNAT family N-acetyltransferase [Hyphomicrobiales bacterium]